MSTELEKAEARAETLLGQLRAAERELSGSKSILSDRRQRDLIRTRDEILAKYRPLKSGIKKLRRERLSRPEGAAGQLTEIINRLAAFRDAIESMDEVITENRSLEKELQATKDYARELQAQLAEGDGDDEAP